MPRPPLGAGLPLALLLPPLLLALVAPWGGPAGPRLAAAHTLEVNISVPHEMHVEGTDVYVCAAQHLPDAPHRLVGVVPRATMDVVHHILLFGESPLSCAAACAVWGAAPRWHVSCCGAPSTCAPDVRLFFLGGGDEPTHVGLGLGRGALLLRLPHFRVPALKARADVACSVSAPLLRCVRRGVLWFAGTCCAVEHEDMRGWGGR